MQTEIKTVQRLFAIMLTAGINSILSDYNGKLLPTKKHSRLCRFPRYMCP